MAGIFISGMEMPNYDRHIIISAKGEVFDTDYRLISMPTDLKAIEIPSVPWRTDTPTETGDYICAFRMCDGSIEYGWCNWNNGAWDILCDNDPFNGTCELVAWQKITPFKGETDGSDD